MCVSCVFVPLRYYYPESNSGEVIYAFCIINEGIPRGIQFSQQDIRISTSLERYEGKNNIILRIEVAKGKTLKLKSNTIQVFWEGNDQLGKEVFRNIGLVGKPQIIKPTTQEYTLDTNEPLMGQRIEKENGEWYTSFVLASYLNIPDADEFSVILPQFAVNEELVILPVLRFKRKWIITIGNMLGMLHC